MDRGEPVEASSGPCWVLEMEKMLVGTDLFGEMARWSKPSIYRVPKWVKKMTIDGNLARPYKPLLVSLGPFHHDKSRLLPMEDHKRRAVLHIVKRSGKPLSEFIAAIEGVAEELLDSYDNLDVKWRKADRDLFVKMMVLDGCFLLEILKGFSRKEAPRDYATNDPVFSVQGMLRLWVGIRCDMLVIENQIPLLALYKLEEIWRGTTPPQLSEKEINNWVLDFVWDPVKDYKPRERIVDDKLCLHPLDIYHKNFCGLHRATPGTEMNWESSMHCSVEPKDAGKKMKWESSMHCAVELKEAGIHLTKCDNNTHIIDYKNCVLSIPTVSIDHDGTAKIFLNLLTFERLHIDAGSEATDYMIFMDNIIDSERDVALLRSKGIIKNLLSSDKEAAQLFNNLSRGAVLSPFSRLHEVRRKVNAHCGRPWNRWRAIFQHTYVSNPWILISLMAAAILLIATLLQTIYTVVTFYKP